jgi:hypothetical protein
MRPDEQLRATDVTSVINATLMMGPSGGDSRTTPVVGSTASERVEFLSTLCFLFWLARTVGDGADRCWPGITPAKALASTSETVCAQLETINAKANARRRLSRRLLFIMFISGNYRVKK